MAHTPTDDTAPATKADIAAIMGEIGKLYDANERWKEELKRHFDVTVENLKEDFRKIFADRTEQHTDQIGSLNRRLRRVERELGLVA